MKALLQLFAIVFFTIQLNAQQINISGVVLDNSGMPLPGVNIIEKGTSNGTQSNFDGKYTITAKTGGTLAFSYVGFTTFEKKIKKNISILNVTLKQDAAQLEEVVVTGYGIKKEKMALGYAVSSSNDQKVVIRGMSSLSGSVNGISGAANHITVRNNTNLDTDNEAYGRIQENIFKRVEAAPFSTFSIDVDKAGYSNIRRFINNGQEVPQDAVKIEEMINYFSYDYPQPSGDDPFSISTEVASSPWNADAKLVRIGIKGKDVSTEKVPASNLVFLLDVSGSMNNPNKLPLLKSALHILVNQLRETDKVSIVVYAGAAGLVLEPTSGINKKEIMQAIDKLSAGGSTSGGEGIALAYKIAEDNFIKGGNNRVILATDGDFNVGASSDRAMENLISEKRENGVFLTCLGFGMGNYKDSKMETLADKGNGNHAYIDTMQEAHKVLGTEFFGTIYTIAKDVKIQVEFNPGKVQAYRLVGYENRLLNDEDFKDDTKDAGELGSGHTVTALYEIIPVGVKSKYNKDLPELKYTKTSTIDYGNEMLTVKFRYKEPDGNKSKMIEKTVMDRNTNFENATEDFKYAASVALFGMQLRNSEFINSFETNDVITMAEAGKGMDKDGYRSEFIRLVKSYN
ncbi:MAG: Ca-activated chloride channel family protein [Sediminicola sp.]|jgi:Ca-activated chloride channel family protein